MSPSSRLLGLLLVVGGFTQCSQAVLLRELLAAFQGVELALGAFYGSWLAWIGLGGFLATRLTNYQRILQRGVVTLPLALLAGMLLLRFSRFLLQVPESEFIPLGSFLLLTATATLPGGLLLGMIFPAACRLLMELSTSKGTVQSITHLYLVESLGALLGGILFTFLLVESLGSWATFALTSSLLLLTNLLQDPPASRRISTLLAVAFGLLALPWPGQPLLALLEDRHFKMVHTGMKRVDSVESRFGQVTLAQLGNQYSLLHDGRLGESFPDARRALLSAAYLLAQSPSPLRILLLGGVESGLPEEMLRYPIQQLTLVEEDPSALAMLQPWLPATNQLAMQDPRFSLVVADGRAFVQNTQKNAYDLVVILSGEPVNARQNRLHTREFHLSLSRILSPAGVVCTTISSASNYMGHEIISYSATMDRTLALTFPHRSVAPGDKQLFCASSKPGVVTTQPSLLAKRHQQFQPEGDNLPAIAFLSLLPTEQTRTLRLQLDKANGEINRDQRPVHFYLNLLLWSKLTHSEAGNLLEGVRRLGSWPFLLPALFFFLYLSLTGITGQRSQQNWQRNSGMAGVAMGGLAAMGLQLMVLYGFQAMVGAVFSQIALLNGLFMAGLALGAWLIGQRWQLPLWPMVILLFFIALLALALPYTLATLSQQSLFMRQAGCWGLSLLLGLATGTIFPLGVALTNQQQAMTASGLVEAADHLGGALGGLFTGSLLIPLLGMEQTGVVIALLTTLAAGSLLLADRWPVHHALPQFRWSPLAMLLTAVALTCWLLAILHKEMQPPPQTRFTPEVLQEVTGNNDLTFSENPFPHYLRPDQMVLASQPVAGEIRGYAGPLNLLVALDHKGRLLAARHLHSHETPSYIEGIDIWLEGLQGHDFSRTSLQEAGVDGMSGATITSKAALAILDTTARQALQHGFHLQLTHQATTSRNHHPWLYPLALLFLLLIPVVWRQRERERLFFLALSLLLLGFVTNALWHEVDVANLSLGRWPSWSSNPLGTLMALAGVGMTLLFGQLYCGFLCPFGALQEFFSRIGKRLGWRRSTSHDALAPWWRGGVMVGSFSLFWWTDSPSWISFNPMQSLFSDHLSQLLAGLAVLSLLASLFFFRYWCRWWCPLGAILSLGNRFALLARLLPHRRISHCDVAVESSWDGGCLHCYRCLPEHELHNSIARQGQNVDNGKLPVLWLLFTVVTLALLMIHWQDALEASHESPGGWRRVDVDTLQQHIRQQRLSDREAMWYRKVP